MENNKFTDEEVELIRKITSSVIEMFEENMEENPEAIKKFMVIVKSMHNNPQVILAQGYTEIKWVKEIIFEQEKVEEKDKLVLEKILLKMDATIRQNE